MATPVRVIDDWKSQLDSGGVPQYVETARRFRHGLQVVLFLLPDGRAGSPKLTIDTRGDKREEKLKAS